MQADAGRCRKMHEAQVVRFGSGVLRALMQIAPGRVGHASVHHVVASHACTGSLQASMCLSGCKRWSGRWRSARGGRGGGEGWRPLVEDVSAPHRSSRYMSDKVDALHVLLVHPCARANKKSTRHAPVSPCARMNSARTHGCAWMHSDAPVLMQAQAQVHHAHAQVLLSSATHEP